MQVHLPTSAGSLIKKIVEINPRLSVQDIMAIIRQATEKLTAGGEAINEAKAISLARSTLNN